MNLDEYDLRQQLVFSKVRHRIKTVGASQYDNGATQKFESKTLDAIMTDAQEEIEDCIAYLVQFHVRLSKIIIGIESQYDETAQQENG